MMVMLLRCLDDIILATWQLVWGGGMSVNNAQAALTSTESASCAMTGQRGDVGFV